MSSKLDSKKPDSDSASKKSGSDPSSKKPDSDPASKKDPKKLDMKSDLKNSKVAKKQLKLDERRAKNMK